MAGEVGADISYFQSFNASLYGDPFIFIRATFGTSLIDPQFVNFRNQARAKGIPYRAYYHFLVANVAVQTQFNFFANVVGNLQPGENVMIDDESYGPTGGLPSAAMVQQFSQLCFNRWGIWPIHYSLAGRTFKPDPQTDASYSASNPGGDFWQYSDGTYNYTALPKSAGGIGNCDMNRCNGTLSSYFLGGAAPAAQPQMLGGGMGLVALCPRGDSAGNLDICYVQPGGHEVLHAWGTNDTDLQQESLGGWADERFGVSACWIAPNKFLVQCIGVDGKLYSNFWAGSWWGWKYELVAGQGMTPLGPALSGPGPQGPEGPAGKDGAPGTTLDQATVDQMVKQSVNADVAPAIGPAVAAALDSKAIAAAIEAAMKTVTGS